MKKLILLTVLISISNFSSAQKKEFSWLVGTWKLKDKNMYETWKVASDGKTLDGFSFKIKDSDTTTLEQIRLTYSGNSFHYIPLVKGNPGPVDFTITSHDKKSFVAENPQHDFPKIIRYNFIRKEKRDFIHATIEGNGKVIPYDYERVE